MTSVAAGTAEEARFVRASSDLTERKRTEKTLWESEDRYHILFDLCPMAVYSCDASGVIEKFNQRAVELWGREPAPGDTDERFCGSFKLFRPDGSFMRHEQCPMAKVVSGTLAQVCDGEVLLERPDGSRITVIVNIRPLKNARGEVRGAINCFYDITERKKVEEELRRSLVKLADSDHHKSEFLGMLAHELRNPLATIRAGLEIKRLKEAPAVDRVTALMERQVSHLVGLVDDLLDLNRIGLGKIDLHRQQVDLATIVQTGVETARSLSERMGHELIVTLPSEPICVNVDPLRLVQVVGNLLNNAIKFTEKGGRILLSVEREGPQAVIRVRDNGMGIAADQLALVFNMFMQADVSVERSSGGLGIGLALVKNFVEMQDGTVEAHSAGLGQGSEFVVRLPIEAGALQARSAGPSVDDLANRTVRRVLVVDDNRDAAESLEMLLKLSGHETHLAYDGLEAVEAAARLKPDLVLLDIGLPKINGYEAARRIRNQPCGRSVVLVALTGWGQDEDRQKSRDAGFDGHLIKPLEPDLLARLLAEFPSVASIR